MHKNINYPRVSIGLPTYNGGHKIRRAITSLLAQGYPNLEIIVSDNCSSDNTEAVCTYLAETEPSLKYFRQSRNIGVMANFDFVLRQASGDFFMWISDDDWLADNVLFKYVDFLVRNPDYSLVSGKIRYWAGEKILFHEEGFTLKHRSGFFRALNFYFKVVYGSIFYGLMRKQFAQDLSLTNRIGEDWHFVAKMARYGKIRNLPNTGLNKRTGGLSENFKRYAQAIGASSFSAKFPHLKIALDAFSEMLHFSPANGALSRVSRFLLASLCFSAIVIRHYGIIYPFIIGGKLKRMMGLKTVSPVKKGEVIKTV